MDLQVMLLQISNKLNDTEVGSLKFLCWKLGKRRLESVQSATDLFSLLQERREISEENVDSLMQLLGSIKRDDLVTEVAEYKTKYIGDSLAPGTQERDPLDDAFDVICDNVGKDWKMLVRRLGVTDVTIERIVGANPSNMREQLYQCLRSWKKDKGDKANMENLLQTLLGCKMKLVYEKVLQKLNSGNS
ncbi:Fas associated via death domain S homeolog [Xenopus laevis]|uniref:Fas associated via death domain S homeolog n=2 Tax=Xenopus laevis TaxID=8355 RepID=Q5J2J1_XENLA|nr:Fas associated via death domain S homeolog [Xenopus laevis]AAI69608.1 Fas-associating death domain-containing protein [Xenopus laevis]AAI70543.1 Fas-associating death domain-containing protein [Xenopus laevis]AAS92972.1 Fas-associating death domain-containing protein [Xenopus laevis]OCT81951.1 hypothetical protein XELAEV_18024459mg [Xenopus laevis]